MKKKQKEEEEKKKKEEVEKKEETKKVTFTSQYLLISNIRPRIALYLIYKSLKSNFLCIKNYIFLKCSLI